MPMVKMTKLHPIGGKGVYDRSFSVQEAEKALLFHQGLSGYRPTRTHSLPALSERLGLLEIYVKDESTRFGLNAFKSLGGSYALHRFMCKAMQAEGAPVQSVPKGYYTFVTATDGNHGRGIAWAARNFGQNAVVYMPQGSSQERLENIRAQGAKAEIIPLNYDDTVRFARQQAQKNGWVLVQDTAWEGYEEIPLWIMQGYMTMGAEAVKQLPDEPPTHIFLQAGVGAMAGAMTGFFADYYAERKPKIIIVETSEADCLFRTAEANDGKLHQVKGELNSIMAGLCCGEACTVGWEVLRHHADYFFSCPDYVAANGMRVLGNPLSGDEKIVSGESGAVTAGLLYELMTDDQLADLKREIGLGQDSRVLCISTEGDTDKENYRRIVWDGWYRKSTVSD